MSDAPTPEPPVDPDATVAFEPGPTEGEPLEGQPPEGGPPEGGPPEGEPPEDGGRNVWRIVFAVVVILLLFAILLALLLRDGDGGEGPTTTTTEESTTTSSTTTSSTTSSTSTTTSSTSTTTSTTEAPAPTPACNSEALLAATGGSIDGHPIEVVEFACASSDDAAGAYAWALVEATDVVLDPLNVFFEADGDTWRTLDYGTGIVCDDVIPSTVCDSMPGVPR